MGRDGIHGNSVSGQSVTDCRRYPVFQSSCSHLNEQKILVSWDVGGRMRSLDGILELEARIVGSKVHWSQEILATSRSERGIMGILVA